MYAPAAVLFTILFAGLPSAAVGAGPQLWPGGITVVAAALRCGAAQLAGAAMHGGFPANRMVIVGVTEVTGGDGSGPLRYTIDSELVNGPIHCSTIAAWTTVSGTAAAANNAVTAVMFDAQIDQPLRDIFSEFNDSDVLVSAEDFYASQEEYAVVVNDTIAAATSDDVYLAWVQYMPAAALAAHVADISAINVSASGEPTVIAPGAPDPSMTPAAINTTAEIVIIVVMFVLVAIFVVMLLLRARRHYRTDYAEHAATVLRSKSAGAVLGSGHHSHLEQGIGAPAKDVTYVVASNPVFGSQRLQHASALTTSRASLGGHAHTAHRGHVAAVLQGYARSPSANRSAVQIGGGLALQSPSRRG